ncbi:hypothetical protein BCR32DRAFT_278441 [Anaeromyces robustus]|uniref:Uncharacterized protein n=1 Tax=Anaeromyces robustus TaxID=1754192 RepID=A0A1Y1XB59_9FUNG|nr:hypothetical protein BCR32DRAFT_278441 [Anaeromyces robustus]|eukprot:ORX82980.1 hypothetical protein BCR32DRAFT_278441 [Anaeromyces robustus]
MVSMNYPNLIKPFKIFINIYVISLNILALIVIFVVATYVVDLFIERDPEGSMGTVNRK